MATQDNSKGGITVAFQNSTVQQVMMSIIFGKTANITSMHMCVWSTTHNGQIHIYIYVHTLYTWGACVYRDRESMYNFIISQY